MQTVTIHTDTVIVSGRIKEEEKEEIQLQASKQRLSRSKFIAEAIRHYLNYLRSLEAANVNE